MARNAHPEVTRERILDEAALLFAKQGYEHTSIQNILDALGNLSKGAIYHHFPSKKAILDALEERDSKAQLEASNAIMERNDLTAIEKLREIFRSSLSMANHQEFIRMALPQLDDPTTFAATMRFTARELPERWLPLIEEGIEDGSIPTSFPREAAQLLALLPNYWLNPHFYPFEADGMTHRLRCLATMLDAIGVPLFDDELIALTERGFDALA